MREFEKRGLIIMTALVPTIGHERLVDFASNFIADPFNLDVVISVRSFEPTTFEDRALSFNHLANLFCHADDNAPQNEPQDAAGKQQFWDYWKNAIAELTGTTNYQYVFASEIYGKQLAELFGAEFIPVDINREVITTKGSVVRRNIFGHAKQIESIFRSAWSQEIVMFGPESCGKTSTAKLVAKRINGGFYHEWARPYLETVGPETTNPRMTTIVKGQITLEEQAANDGNLIRVFDTDIVTTLGFYRLYNIAPDYQQLRIILNQSSISNTIEMSNQTLEDYIRNIVVPKNRLYIVCNDLIPFERDQLRYGGDRRETDIKFWTDILDEFQMQYYLLQATDRVARCSEIINYLTHNCPLSKAPISYHDLIQFRRD